jgi:hypothetical protein
LWTKLRKKSISKIIKKETREAPKKKGLEEKKGKWIRWGLVRVKVIRGDNCQ